MQKELSFLGHLPDFGGRVCGADTVAGIPVIFVGVPVGPTTLELLDEDKEGPDVAGEAVAVPDEGND